MHNHIATLASTIKRAIANRLKNLHTALPGRIESFDPETQLAAVQPLIQRVFVDSDGREGVTIESLPLIVDVPVLFPRGGGYSITFPVKVGEECLLVFCERSIDNWHQTGDIQPPGGKRYHHLSDAVAILGLSSKPHIVPDYDSDNVFIGKDDRTVSITLKSDSIDMETQANLNIACKSVMVVGDMEVDGNITCAGLTESATIEAQSSLKVGGKEMSKHVHQGSPTAAQGPQSPTGEPL